jgi:hypothetical protein
LNNQNGFSIEREFELMNREVKTHNFDGYDFASKLITEAEGYSGIGRTN